MYQRENTFRVALFSLLVLSACGAGCSELQDPQSGGTANAWDPSYIGGQTGSETGALCVGLTPEGAFPCSELEPDVLEEDISDESTLDIVHTLSDADSATGEEADAGSTEEDVDAPEESTEAGEELDAESEESESSGENGALITFADDATGEEEDAETGETGDDEPFIPGAPAGPPAEPEPEPEDAGDPCEIAPGTCPGTPAPPWDLCDFQPQSCGHDQVYGLSTYTGTVTFVALFASW